MLQIVRELKVHDCEPEIYAAFAATFGEKQGGSSRWTEFVTTDGIRVTFFASSAPATGGDDD